LMFKIYITGGNFMAKCFRSDFWSNKGLAFCEENLPLLLSHCFFF